ncbi:MAG TPA: hypothetical protein VHL58_20735 [Thermoanaerobaculia bacterium]|nr:hypothetical protein [Thermoanaerobaculia bacterium]
MDVKVVESPDPYSLTLELVRNTHFGTVVETFSTTCSTEGVHGSALSVPPGSYLAVLYVKGCESTPDSTVSVAASISVDGRNVFQAPPSAPKVIHVNGDVVASFEVRR